MSTKKNPGNFPCHANALPYEEMFTVLARDETMPDIHPVQLRLQKGLNEFKDEQIQEALRCAERAEEQRLMIRRALGKE